MSSIVNKVKEVLHSDKHSSSSAPEGSHGPHNSRAANAADPRVDSDRDGSHTAGRTAGHGEFGSTNTTGLGSSHTGYGEAREGEHGPHGSRVANTIDPRVDSDRDGSRTVGNTGNTGGFSSTHNTHNTHNTHGTHGTSGLGSTGYGETREGEHGPHSSRIANAVDPRVDSDRDGSRTAGNTGSSGFGSSTHGNTHTHGNTGVTGTHGDPAGTHGPHSSRAANVADPRVDSDRDGRGAIHTGPGPAPNTAGPHKSDVLNKVDPRVDSDLDGSRTVGNNQTYQ